MVTVELISKELPQEYKDHDHILIANVDCIGAGKSKCAEVGIKTFPTLKPLGQYRRFEAWSWQLPVAYLSVSSEVRQSA